MFFYSPKTPIVRPTIGAQQFQLTPIEHQRLSVQIADALNRGSGSSVGDVRRSNLTHQPSIGDFNGGERQQQQQQQQRRRSRQISMAALMDELEISNKITLTAAQGTTTTAANVLRRSIDQSTTAAATTTTTTTNNNNNFYFQGAELNASSPVDSLFSISDLRRFSKVMPAATATLVGSRAGTTTLIVRRPTISLQEDGRYMIDHVTARWDSSTQGAGGLLDGDDGATIITDTLKDDLADGKKGSNFIRAIIKYIKILTPHVILVSVLVGYLCLGAWILMLLETKTELMARSRKLVRLTNLMTNFTADSWRLVNEAQTGVRSIHAKEWEEIFGEYMLKVSETVDDRRPIRWELKQPDNLNNMHNKWTFPTSLLYVLTVLTTCGYNEVSVDTETGKVFSVIFAFIGIPLMFITAADIGKFLSETLLKFVQNWNLMTKRIKEFFSQKFLHHHKYVRRKSLQSTTGIGIDNLGIMGIDGAEEKLWFPIGAYVGCICLYCSMGSAMFINWETKWSFIHAFHFGFNLIVTVGLGDIVVTDYLFLSLIVAFVIVGLSVVTMCVDLASTHLKAYFTRIHYFGRAKRFLGMSEELKEIVALLGAMRKKKNGKVTWHDVRDFLDNELRDRPFEPHELLMKLRFIDETTSSGMSTNRHNSFQSDLFRDSEYFRRLTALRPDKQPAYL